MALWTAAKPLVLASQSEVRRKILASAGVPLEVRPATIDERAVEGATRRTGEAAARVLAAAKAQKISADMPGRLVLGADQTLTLGERQFSKPRDRADALEQLRALRGKTHVLHSALALVNDGKLLFEHVAQASLTMRPLSEEFLSLYLDTAGSDVLASVGGYQVESAGIHLFERIDGDYFTILGLPLLPLLDFLRSGGYLAG